MDDVLGYAGKSVVVTGAASGMGEATARILVDLGAQVTALDIKETKVPVARALRIDLRDRENIEQVAASIDGPIDGLFSCAGLPGPPFSEWDTILVNFVGARHLAELLVPKMSAGSAISVISSSAAIGWQDHIPVITELLETEGFDGAVNWLREHEKVWSWSGYAYSKYIIDAWVGWWYPELAKRGIRINCINPGPTETAMMPAFQNLMGKDVVDQAVGPIGRYSTPEEQAWPLVCLGSPRFSYVAGEVLWTDGGWNGAMTMGRHQAQWAEDTGEMAKRH
ncbi:short chain dehydrogenase family protein [Mycolicibacterium hassiacum DSM 44199]|uniref:Short chain dehydrogenase family protein n=1 Tax=Mycolicibacterium hassiacum (strain DSM 44199 / CIP 105218 / JCM 12690 / 3849) TaxID=1122247 RepID=K5B797_MYCHD|nr:SDR family oxidoreductase [Mycolicibacterium hassiacum]EKF21568.1 short chain dehydrogenase family protein [Mycolicibacterium hassiacum DSM 44199]MBX5486070.1 SDR family oxidoreductase [Mycolicibacterium hassiacum]MDA4085001.1 3-alpha-hydroxysteroid dehydrogenase [Mycolicibacterium hassiacum DSM 44199]PZN23346.1 MAG: 3-alpha-hydroxysteroid dehydrogenase [Mycolicibacterium hassiacum]VCT89084.1 Coniferyl-alcohol dehydrogenase [Mycolicibacterium hassiacum DSM 44199]